MERLFDELAQEREKLRSRMVSTNGTAGVTCVMATLDAFVLMTEKQSSQFMNAWRLGYRPVGFVKWETHLGDGGRYYIITATSSSHAGGWAKLMLASAEEEIREMLQEGSIFDNACYPPFSIHS